jgi:hypothetical protein
MLVANLLALQRWPASYGLIFVWSGKKHKLEREGVPIQTATLADNGSVFLHGILRRQPELDHRLASQIDLVATARVARTHTRHGPQGAGRQSRILARLHHRLSLLGCLTRGQARPIAACSQENRAALAT